MSLRRINIIAAKSNATAEPIHKPETGSTPTAVAKSVPEKKSPTYSIPIIEKIIRTTIGKTKSYTLPLSDTGKPLYCSTALGAPSKSDCSVTTVSTLSRSSGMPALATFSKGESGSTIALNVRASQSRWALPIEKKSLPTAQSTKTNTIVINA